MSTMKPLTLLDIVQTNTPWVAPDCSLGEAVTRMRDGQFSSLLVVDAQQALGILTEHDLVRLLHDRTPSATPIREVMSSPVLTVASDMDIHAAYAWLLKQHIRHLVVEAPDKSILGIVGENDFRRYMGFDVLRQLDQLDGIIDKELPTLPPYASLKLALDMMLRERVSYVLVTEEHCPLGLLTEKDIPTLLLQFAQHNPEEVTLAEVMTSPVPSTHARQSVSSIASLMQARNWEYLVITDTQQHTLGVVTLHNLLGRITSTLLNQQVRDHQHQLESALHQTTDRMNMIADAAHLGLWELDLKSGQLLHSDTLRAITGRDEHSTPNNLDEWLARIHPDDHAEVMQKLNAALYSENLFEVEYRAPHAHGHWMWLHVRGQIVQHDSAGNATYAVGTAMDITQRKRLETTSENERHVLELLAKNLELPVFLSHLALGYESLFEDVLCSVLLLDLSGKYLHSVAAPSLPESYAQQLGQLEIDPQVGSCGTAAYHRELILVDDTTTDPRWKNYQQLANTHHLRTAWATPVVTTHGKVLGTFAMYSTVPRPIHPDELSALRRAAHFAALAVERAHTEQALRQNKEILKRAQAVAQTGSWVIELSNNAIEWSSETYHIFGIPTQQPIDLTRFLACVHPDDRQAVATAWQAAVAGANYDIEHRILVQNEIRYVRERAQLEYDDSNHPVRGIGTVQDITEAHRTREQMQLLAQAVEQSYNAILITDLNANIQYANTSFLQRSGYTLDEVIGNNPRIFKSSKTPTSVYINMWAHLNAGKAWRGELVNRRKDGSEYYEITMISPVRQADGRITNYLAVKEDITRLKAAEESAQQFANYDALTGLPNRTLLTERAHQTIALAQHNNRPFAVLFLDLDHFKNINDTLGHRVGDALLLELSNRLQAAIRREDTLSRTGGDEFVFLLSDTDAVNAALVAEKLLSVLAQTCHIEQQDLTVTGSIGIAMYPEDGANFDALGQCADVAMYRAKQNGRNTVRLFTPDMQSMTSRQMRLENSLRHAIQRQEMCLHYQPQLALESGKVVGAEVLLRWQHPEFGCVSPAEFIPIAEESGQILHIGEWVLRTAMCQLRTWIDQGLPALPLAVNLSAIQFRSPNLLETITDILHENDLPPHLSELELTESVAMDDPKTVVSIMDKLYQRGVSLSIDDFGTGYSSLSYLKRFKVHKLKIDQSFVRHLIEDTDDRAIIVAIINMANSLGFTTIAEGVETQEQMIFLKQQGCHQVQGYFLSRPLPAAQFMQFLQQHPPT